MKVEHPAELPEVLQGIFFMDGNVLPDDCLTMYSSDWNADQLTLLLRVFDPVIWTFHSSMGGRILVYLVKFSRFTYLFRFSDATLSYRLLSLLKRSLLNHCLQRKQFFRSDSIF